MRHCKLTSVPVSAPWLAFLYLLHIKARQNYLTHGMFCTCTVLSVAGPTPGCFLPNKSTYNLISVDGSRSICAAQPPVYNHTYIKTWLKLQQHALSVLTSHSDCTAGSQTSSTNPIMIDGPLYDVITDNLNMQSH